MMSSRRVVRRWAWVALAFVVFVPGNFTDAQETAPPKQVLVLNAARLSEQFSVVTEREMPKLLAAGLRGRVEYFTEYFDHHRFPHPAYEAVYVDFLRRKYEGRRFDLIVLIGDVAVQFMTGHRDTLFPGTPVVFSSLTPPGRPIRNATGLVNRLRFGPSIEIALALQPDLAQVYVVSGATAVDQVYERQAREEFHPYEGRVSFTYLSGLTTEALERRLRALPPRSAVYYVAVFQDGAGETPQQMRYLARLAGVANAPTYSWADTSVDAGIVGGRRRDQQAQVNAIAALALRVLGGEAAGSIPVSSPEWDVDQVDWRQLRRWQLDESRVPAGTAVVFRPLSMWDQYRRYIIGAIVLFLAQAALIGGLLVHRAQRQRIEFELRSRERELRGSEARLRGSYEQIRDLSRRLLGEQEAERARIARELHDDINQQLALLAFELESLRGVRIQNRTSQRITMTMDTVRGIATSVRELSHRLHPSRLRLMGLVVAIETLLRDVSVPHVSIAFHHHDVPPAIDENVAVCVFRVVQEAVGNAVKHSGARHIRVDLAGAASSVALTVADDGKGFDIDGPLNGGLGLISMRERVESVGGALEIQTRPAGGTRVIVIVPMQAPEAALTAASA